MPDHSPAAGGLPDPSHLQRLPPQLSEEQLLRIRRQAFQLPQVVKPADFFDPQASDLEGQLDRHGFVLLSRPAGGARPSRWIAPDAVEAALRHLDAVQPGPTARATMLQRAAALETLGIVRRVDRWERLAHQTLPLATPDVRLQLAYHVPIAAEPVWDFYRDGDQPALLQALGAAPPAADAGAMAQHLDRLLVQAMERSAQQTDSLMPRLQAELSRPDRLQALQDRCSRAVERWLQRVAEIETMEGLNADLAFQGYPDTFALARRLKRRVRLFVGPPNSGKTHAAFEQLAKAENGAYLAPLRLLALEGRDRLQGRGVACSLLTGEENVPAEGARLVSSTVEMVSTGKEVALAVVDEAQMIFDAYRGWAWTQAIAGVPARELIVICSAFAVPAIENLLGLCGERAEVVHYERKQHVQLLPTPVPLSALRLGDAVVAFSRRDVLLLRDQIAASGLAVSVIYGALPPEVRRREAERFAQGASQVLVATDAIGMGLNLPIRRVLFSTLTKFDGVADRPLDESEVHQIAGRAGRYGLHEEGFAGVLKEAEPGAAKHLKEMLAKPPRAPRDFKAPVAPNWWHVDTIATRLGKTRLHEVLGVFMAQLTLDNAHFAVAELEQMLELAEQLDRTASALPLRSRFTYAQAPVDTRTEAQIQHFLDWAGRHAIAGRAGTPWFLDEVDEHSRLDRMEQALRSCTLWLWLDLRFEGVYGHVDEVVDLRSRLNDGIERQLKGKKPLAQLRRGRR